MTDNYLKFDNKFVGDVIDEKKQATIRKGESFVEPAQEVELRTANGNVFGECIIKLVREMPAKDVVEIDFENYHRNYSGFNEFKKQMEEYYDDIEPSTTFSVIGFVLI